MPARTLNDFFAGFFYDHRKADDEVRMAITEQSDQRRGDIKIVRIEGDKEQEMTTCHEAVPPERREVDMEMA